MTRTTLYDKLQVRCLIAAALAVLCTPALADETNGGKVDLKTGWAIQDVAKVAAGGAEVSTVGYRPAAWHAAVVPGTVLANLVRDGVYPEPLYGLNNLKIPESLARTRYWYRTVFHTPKFSGDRHVWLDFEGINRTAEVWLDGSRVGEIRGAFARGRFDVTRFVSSGKDAALAVLISPPPHPGTPHEQSVLRGTGPNGGVIGQDSPTFVATIGWDWIPGIRDRASGIWQNVSVYTTGPVSVSDPYVVTELPLPKIDSADLTVRVTVHNLETPSVGGTLAGRVPGASVAFQRPLDLAAGETREVTLTAKDVPALHMIHPRLWWPNGYGRQDMYKLQVSFAPHGQDVSDESVAAFGVRSIQYFREGSKDLTVIVNGVPIFCRGGNWGMDEALKRIPRERLDAQIRMHRDANLNMIRNWVGQSTEEDFYDLCDKYGILVWNDFALANPADGPNPNDADMFLANARDIVTRYRNHPSIAVWCGRNEGFPPPKINEGLAKMIAELDGVRFYQPHSSYTNGVGGGGPYALRPYADYFGQKDAFHTEVGMPSVPTIESIHGMMPKQDWDSLNDDWAYHDLTRGAQGGDRYVGEVQARLGPLAGLADFVRKAEFVSYEGYRAMFEGREASLFSPSTGVLLWMTHPSQPSFVWQLYSYDLEPTAALFGTKKACEPVHVQLDPRNGDVEVVNQTPLALKNITVGVRMFTFEGHPLSSISKTLDTAAPSSSTVALRLPADDADQPRMIRLEIHTKANDIPSRNDYFLGAASTPDDISSLCRLPEADVSVQAVATRLRGNIVVNVYLDNRSKVLCPMIHLQLRRAKSGLRVLPAFYSDNFVDLLPGESKTINITASAKDLDADRPLVALDGWNLELAQSSSKSGGVPCVLDPEMTVAPYTPSGAIRINCGGAWTGPFTSDAFHNDEYVTGGGWDIYQGAVDVKPAGLPASESLVYDSDRRGEATYDIPVADRAYTVRLHFAETEFDQPGERKFNVSVGGTSVLTDFDVFAAAGGKDKAIVKVFKDIHPDSTGHIVIKLTNGAADRPEIRAIELLPQ